MNRFFFVGTVTILALGIGGCVDAYQQERVALLTAGNLKPFGPPPPKDWHQTTEAFVRRLMKDPDSAKFEFQNPHIDTIPDTFGASEAIPVWTTCVLVNAKNSFGGYVGAEPYLFVWKNGRMTHYASPFVSDSGDVSIGPWQSIPFP